MQSINPLLKARRLQLELLEARVLYSAELAGGLLLQDDYLSGREADELDPSSVLPKVSRLVEGSVSELVIVDGGYHELEILHHRLSEQTYQGRHIEFLLIDTSGSTAEILESIGISLSQYADLRTVHLITHAESGQIKLGANIVDTDELEAHAHLLEGWDRVLSNDAEILVYGCNLTEAEAGKLFAEQLARLTSAEVAASDDITGHSDLGGDWLLEFSTGEIESKTITQDMPQLEWRNTLDVTTGLVHHWTLDSTPNDSIGTADLQFFGGANYAAGLSADGLMFDGDVTPFLRFASADPADYAGLGAADFTISLWVNPSTTAEQALLLGDFEFGIGFTLEVDTSGRIGFTVANGSGSIFLESQGVVASNEWRLVNVVKEGTDFRVVLLDETGSLNINSLSSPQPTGSLAAGGLHVGSLSGTAADYDGLLDDIRIYHRALSTADLQALALGPSTPVNTAPVADNTAHILSVNEDRYDPPGITIQSLVLNASDSDAASSILGVAVNQNTSTANQGVWQYSTNFGASWNDMGSVSETAALVLRGNTGSDLVRFVPAFDYNGSTPDLQLHAIDNTWSGSFSSGENRAYADISGRGGSSPFSANSTSLGASVGALNDSPHISSITDALLESSLTPVSNPDGLASGDFDSDGDEDVVITSSSSNEVWVGWNQGNGVFADYEFIGNPDSPQNPHIADIDGDGNLDIAVVSNHNTGVNSDVVIFHGDGAGDFSINGITYSGSGASDLTTSDIDGNGLLDIIVTYSGSSELTAHFQTSARVFSTVAILGTPDSPRWVSRADMDNDGDEDILSASVIDGNMEIYVSGLTQGVGFFAERLLAGSEVSLSEIADLDLDGDQDIVLGDWNGSESRIIWIENHGASTPRYSSHVLSISDGELEDLELFDQNGDGNIDIVASGSADNDVIVYRNNGDGRFSPLTLSTGNAFPVVLDAIDLDGSGIDSLLLANRGSSDVELMRADSASVIVRESVAENSTSLLSPIEIDDSDLQGGLIDVQLSVTNGTLSISSATGLVWLSGSAAHDSNKSFRATLSDANNALASLEFVPNLNFNGVAVLELGLSDGGNTGADGTGQTSETIGIFVEPVNNAPSGLSAALAQINEDATDPAGASVLSLFAGGFIDVDQGAQLGGIAVADNSANMQGIWQYSSDAGSSWFDMGAVSVSNALLLDDSSYVRFLPAQNYHGIPPSLQLYIVDDTYSGPFTRSLDRDVADLNVRGGITPFSASTVQLQASVAAVNDDPEANDDLFAVFSGESISASVAGNDEDVDSDPNGLSYSLLTAPGDGTVEFFTDGRFTYSVGNIPNSTDTFVYQLTDGDGGVDSATVSIAVGQINRGPQISLDNQLLSLPEDTDTNGHTRVADVVVSDDGFGFNQIFLSGNDADRFRLSGAELQLRSNTELDFELRDTYQVTIVARDPTLPAESADSVDYQLQIGDVNEAPQIAILDQISSIAESAQVDSSLQLAEVTVTDDALGAETLSLAGEDAALFALNGNVITFVEGASLDFEANPEINLQVQVDDVAIGDGPDNSVDIVIAVEDVNESPTIALENPVFELPENTDTRVDVKIADIVISDDVPGDNTLSLAGNQAELFEISNNTLFLIAGTNLDHEELDQYSIEIRVSDDQLGEAADSMIPYNLMITDSNDPPAVQLVDVLASVSESVDLTQPLRVADIVIEDDALGTVTLALSGPHAALFNISGDGLFITAGAALDAQLTPILDVSVSANDPSLGSELESVAEFSLEIIADAGQLLLLAVETSAVEYTEDDAAIAITSTLLAMSSNDTELTSATVRFVGGYQINEDLLAVDASVLSGFNSGTENVFSQSFDTDAGVLTITGAGNTSQYVELLRGVRFSNTVDNPVEQTRVLEFTVNAEALTSNVVTREIMVSAVNDLPEPVNTVAVTLDPGASFTLDEAILLSVDPDHTPDQIRYSVTEPPAGVEVLVEGVPAMFFTQAQINAGVVSFVHDGSEHTGGQLFLEVDDGSGAIVGLSLDVAVTPDLGAANSAELPVQLQELPATSSNFITAESLLSEIENTEEGGGDTDTAAEIDAEEGQEVRPAAGKDVSTVAAESLQILVALDLPNLPFTVTALQNEPLINDLAEIVIDSADSEVSDSLKNDVLATLLEINPITMVVNTDQWYEWQVENGGFQRSLSALEDSFEEAANQIEQRGLASDLVLGSSVGLTTGFLIWLLRGGTLLASLMSIAPVWKQLDPLPIVSQGQRSSDGLDNDDVETLFNKGEVPDASSSQPSLLQRLTSGWHSDKRAS